MNKIILTIFICVFAVNYAFADDVVQRITYSNGTIVLLCNRTGKIDYCSEQDRQNSIQSISNPNISVVENIMLKQQSDDNSFNQKCYKAQKKIQSGTNLANTIMDTARVITSFIGVSW